MTKPILPLLALALLSAPLAAEAPPAAPPAAEVPAAPAPAPALTFTPEVAFEGPATLLSEAERAEIVRALTAEFPAALQRRFGADFAGLPRTPKLTLVVPAALNPFGSVTAHLDWPNGEGTARHTVSYPLLTLWLQQERAHVYALDRLLAAVPKP